MADDSGAATPIAPLDRLDERAVDAVHDASMHLLEEIGIQIRHEGARSRLEAHGASIHDNDVVTVPRAVVEEHVAAAPHRFEFHGRNPERTVTVGGEGPPVRAPGYGAANVRTFGEGRREATLADYERLLKLAQVEDVITCTGYALCTPTDVEEGMRYYETLSRALELTDQPVMGPAHGETRARACLDMVGIAVGDRSLSKPYVAGLINTGPPRRIGTEMLRGLLAYAEHRQPLVVSSFTMAGASGPPTLAGSLALTNAENLLGITLAQIVSPGTPVVYGAPTAAVDGRYGSLSIGGPASALFASFGAQMARYYDLPSRAGGGLTDAKTVGYQSGFESAFLQAATRFSDVDFVLHAAGILESYSTISPEKLVLDCESIRYLDRFTSGFPIDRADFRLEQFDAVEPGGYFATSDDSSNRSEPEFYRSDVTDKRSYDAWSDDGHKSAFEIGADRVADRLEAYERPSLPADRKRELDAYVAGRPLA